MAYDPNPDRPRCGAGDDGGCRRDGSGERERVDRVRHDDLSARDQGGGGGFDVPSSSQAIAIVYESVKVQQHAWRASVQLLDPGAPDSLTLTTYVYCRKGLPATHPTSTTARTSGEVQVGPTASATCPRDEFALAGGFVMPPPLLTPWVTDLLFDSLRDGISSWDARVVTGPAGPGTLTSEAYCTGALRRPG